MRRLPQHPRLQVPSRAGLLRLAQVQAHRTVLRELHKAFESHSLVKREWICRKLVQRHVPTTLLAPQGRAHTTHGHRPCYTNEYRPQPDQTTQHGVSKLPEEILSVLNDLTLQELPLYMGDRWCECMHRARRMERGT